MDHKIWDEHYIKYLYETIFNRIKLYLPQEAKVLIEVGAGTGIGKTFLPNSICADICFNRCLDATCDSVALPFKSNSADAIILKDAFHHIADVESFIIEAHRVLRIGGRILIFDPYWGLLARFVYRFLHQERFDAKVATWSFDTKSPWDSNQAITYVLLRRDREQFEQKFNRFLIKEHEVLIGPSFLLSGGVSRRTILSGKLLARLLKWEMKQPRWFNILRFFHIFSMAKVN